MKAILLAGGQGRRLRSITGKLPKPMVPLVGVPVLDRLLELLRRNGEDDSRIALLQSGRSTAATAAATACTCATASRPSRAERRALCARAATFTAGTISSSSVVTRRAALTCCSSTGSTKAPAPL